MVKHLYPFWPSSMRMIINQSKRSAYISKITLLNNKKPTAPSYTPIISKHLRRQTYIYTHIYTFIYLLCADTGHLWSRYLADVVQWDPFIEQTVLRAAAGCFGSVSDTGRVTTQPVGTARIHTYICGYRCQSTRVPYSRFGSDFYCVIMSFLYSQHFSSSRFIILAAAEDIFGANICEVNRKIIQQYR